MGSAFAVWDWMFGTLVLAGEKKDLTLGVGPMQNPRFADFTGNIVSPFIDCWNMLLGRHQAEKAEQDAVVAAESTGARE